MKVVGNQRSCDYYSLLKTTTNRRKLFFNGMTLGWSFQALTIDGHNIRWYN